MTENAEGNGGRDRRGRFAKGNQAGRGNPVLVRAHALRNAFRDAVDPTEFSLLAMAMLRQAQKGDVAAARLVLEYCIGRPRQQEAEVAVDLGKLDSARGVRVAFGALASAAAAGQIDVETALAIGNLLRGAVVASELADAEAVREQITENPDYSYL